jgi:hypothetical protein
MRKLALRGIRGEGKFSLLDNVDFDRLSARKWYVDRKGYVRQSHTGKKLHRLVLDAPPDKQVDHINGDKLDNRRANLRLCTNTENQWNRAKLKRNTSGYQGAMLIKSYQAKGWKCWQSVISHNGKKISLGYYATAQEAGAAYNKAAVSLRGEFAALGRVEKSNNFN